MDRSNSEKATSTAKAVSATDIAKMTEGLTAIRQDIKEKAKPKKRYLMCIYFYCPRCTRDWSVDLFHPRLIPCKCGYQKPRVTAIEKVDYTDA